jgi:photosystem II stability/assembly factor-like uncharacterized protein
MWEDITGSILATPTYTGVLVPVVNPKNTATVYATTDSLGVFKSGDCGATWTKINTGRNAKQMDSGRIWAAIIDPIYPDTLFAITGYGPPGVFKTTNGGVDWDQILPNGSDVATVAGGFVERVAMEQTDHNHLLINFHENCKAPHNPVCFGESYDGGVTWVVKDYPTSAKGGMSWGEGSGVAILGPKSLIYTGAWGGINYSGDDGATWSEVTPPTVYGAGLMGDSHTFHTPDGWDYLGSIQGVVRSKDLGATWSLIPKSGSNIGAIAGDGTVIYGVNDRNLFWTAKYSDPMTWTQTPTPGLPGQIDAGPGKPTNIYTMGLDGDHHLLYGALQAGGIWRVRLE